MSGRKYRRYSDEVRQRVIDAYVNSQSWHTVAKENGVLHKVAYGWIRAFIKQKPVKKRGGNKKAYLNEEHIEELLHWIENDPSVKLKTIQHRVAEQFGRQISSSTISRHLDGQLYSLRKACRIPPTSVSFEDVERQKYCVAKIMEHHYQEQTVVWIDELTLNVLCFRNRGHAGGGRTACTTITAARGKSLNVIAAITKQGIVDFQLKRGFVDPDMINSWVQNLLTKIIETANPGSIVLVCDNDPCHSQLEDNFACGINHNVSVLRMHPYSAKLNPLEYVWDIVRNTVRHAIKENHANIKTGNQNPEMTLQEWRSICLDELVKSVMDLTKNGDCRQFVEHTLASCEEFLNNPEQILAPVDIKWFS